LTLRYEYVIIFFIASGVGLSPLYCGHFWPIVPVRVIVEIANVLHLKGVGRLSTSQEDVNESTKRFLEPTQIN
jgi:hypothetical protein